MISRNLKFGILVLLSANIAACSTNPDSNEENQSTTLQSTTFTLIEQFQEILDDPITDVYQTNGSIEYLRINNYMVECEGYQVSHCLLTQKEGSDEWTYFYDHIIGFDYQWGIDYEILVQVQDTDTGLADTSTRQYSLLEVITKTTHESREAFHYVSHKPDERIAQIAPTQYMLLDNKSFTCTAESCSALQSAIAQNQSTLLSFQHNANPVEPLILDSVLCSDATSSFSVSCL